MLDDRGTTVQWCERLDGIVRKRKWSEAKNVLEKKMARKLNDGLNKLSNALDRGKARAIGRRGGGKTWPYSCLSLATPSLAYCRGCA